MFDLSTLANLTLSTTIAKTETFTAKVSDFPEAAIIAFLTYGFQRKFNDAVGGALRNDEPYTPELKVADAKAMIEEYKKGIVSKRREGGSAVTVEVSAARKVMRAMLPKLLSIEDLKTFRALESGDANAKLDAWATANAGAIADAVKAEVKAMNDQAKRRAALTGITVTL